MVIIIDKILLKKSYYYDYGLTMKRHTCQARIRNELSGVMRLYKPCGAGAGAVAVGAASRRVSAAMGLVVLRQAMSGCLFLQWSRLQLPLMTYRRQEFSGTLRCAYICLLVIFKAVLSLPT